MKQYQDDGKVQDPDKPSLFPIRENHGDHELQQVVTVTVDGNTARVTIANFSLFMDMSRTMSGVPGNPGYQLSNESGAWLISHYGSQVNESEWEYSDVQSLFEECIRINTSSARQELGSVDK